MKALFAVIALAFAVNASAATELVLLDGYTGPSKYAKKYTSTLENPFSYALLIPTETGGYCFNGDAKDVLAIVQATAASWTPDSMTISCSAPEDSVVADTTLVGNPLIATNITCTVKEDGTTSLWKYDEIRPCNRKSKPFLFD